MQTVSATSPQVSALLAGLFSVSLLLVACFHPLTLCLWMPRRKHLDLVFLIESAISSLFVDEWRLFKCPVVTEGCSLISNVLLAVGLIFFFLLCEDQEFAGCCVEHHGLFLFSFANLLLSRKLLFPALFRLRQSIFLPPVSRIPSVVFCSID